MKRLPFILVSFFLFISLHLCIFISPAHSQEFDFNQAFQDYLYTFSRYHTSHTEYVAARNAYQTYKTLTSKSEFLDKTIKMLQLRDDVIQTYVTALRLRLADATGISNYQQTVLYLKLDNEVAWYFNHREVFTAAGSLEDLSGLAKATNTQYPKTEALAYQTLGTILIGKEEALQKRFMEEVTKINDKIAEIRQRGDKETSTIERWMLEAENKLILSQDKQSQAGRTLTSLTDARGGQGVFNQVKFLLRESHQYKKEANFYLKEIIREVKRAD